MLGSRFLLTLIALGGLAGCGRPPNDGGLEPTEVRRVTDGSRLGAIRWVPEDGPTEVGALYDPVLDAAVEALFLVDQRAALPPPVMLPGASYAGNRMAFADDTCETPVSWTRWPCPGFRFNGPRSDTVRSRHEFVYPLLSLWRVTDDVLDRTTVFFPSGDGCVEQPLTDGSLHRMVEVPRESLVMTTAFDERSVGARHLERTVTYADGTRTVERLLPFASQCTLENADGDAATRHCWPVATQAHGGFFRSADCQTGELWRSLSFDLDAADAPSAVIVRIDGQPRRFAATVRRNVDEVFVFQQAIGRCVPGELDEGAWFYELGDELDLDAPHTLTLLGDGRLRAVRWVDPRGEAVPLFPNEAPDQRLGRAPVYWDTALETYCRPRDGRCIPFDIPVDDACIVHTDAACEERGFVAPRCQGRGARPSGAGRAAVCDHRRRRRPGADQVPQRGGIRPGPSPRAVAGPHRGPRPAVRALVQHRRRGVPAAPRQLPGREGVHPRRGDRPGGDGGGGSRAARALIGSPPMARTFYQYPKCSTCRRAAKWLAANDVEVTSIDLVATPPSQAELARIHAKSGLPVRKLFNTSGKSYREGGFKAKLETMSEAEALAALAADGKLIKRPLLVDDDVALVGFKEADWAEQLG